jgi:hypothetical protein
VRDPEDRIKDTADHGAKEKREVVVTVSLSTIQRIIKWLRERL